MVKSKKTEKKIKSKLYVMEKNFRGDIVLYKSSEGTTQIDVKLEKETVWLTSNQMTSLFIKARPTVLEHIKTIYDEGELLRDSTCRKFRQV